MPGGCPLTLPLAPQHSLVGAREGTLVSMDQENTLTVAADQAEVTEAVVAEELLVEEISIDGMCGVY